MILRVAHFRTPPDAAAAFAAKAQTMFARIRRSEGLAWSAVGRQPDGDGILIIAVSLWRDRASLETALGAEVDGRSEVEAREGFPRATLLELADVVDGVGLPPGLAPIEGVSNGRRRRGLLPQDRELLRLLCSGVTLAEAAGHLGVSVGTAKNRRHEIYEKLGVHDLGAACAIAAPELALDQAS
jgi:DNA-binding CsgD family transcriptional regulator/quinol monooxygenase YgiN